MQLIDTFAVPVLHYQISDEVMNKVDEIVVPEIEKLERNGNDFEYRLSDFWETKIFYHKLVPELTEEWAKCITHFKEHTSITTSESIHYWTQDYKAGMGHDLHGHGIDGISGTMWIRANENAGYLRLYNPNGIAEYVQHADAHMPYFQAFIDIECTKGKLVLFPSYLKHKVVTKPENVVRTTVAFNVGI